MASKAVVIVILLAWQNYLICQVEGDGYTINDSELDGRTFDGIGGLSGGGATSKFLRGYPEQQRNEILDYLFKPNFGASLHILKVEIGGDAQSTEGTESSHMHTKDDLNFARGYEWWLMSEAKKRNPLIKLYGLSWAYPGWLGNGNPYKDPEATAKYIVMWLQGALWVYNQKIDYIGIWNERPYNTTYIKTLRKALDGAGFTNTQIVAADGNWGISDDILKDKDLADAVHVIGAHYPGTMSSKQAVITGKPLWASEDYSTINNIVGAGCWARILNQNYVNGYMTSTISWNLIAAYYSNLPYDRCGLMTAEEPWSGHYEVSAPIWISAHTTQFTAPGWRYLGHGSGVSHLSGGGSYVTLTGQISKVNHMTIIIETMSHNNSICIRPPLPKYNVVPQKVTFNLTGSLASVKKLYVWYSYLGQNQAQLFSQKTPIEVAKGLFSLNLGVDEVWTLTTVSSGNKGSFPTHVPASKTFPAQFKDNFDGYTTFSEAMDFIPQTGVWEVREKTIGATSVEDKCNTQVVLSQPVDWCTKLSIPINLGGNYNWSDVYISMDVAVPSTRGAPGVFVAARVDRGGCGVGEAQGIFLWVSKQQFTVTHDLAGHSVIVSGSLPDPFQSDSVYSITLSIKSETIKAGWNNKPLFEQALPAGSSARGFVAYGTSDFGLAEFDNVVITSYSSEE